MGHEKNVEEKALAMAAVAREASFMRQFLASMRKNVIQKAETPISCILETIMPVLFVLGAMAIWAAVGSEDYKAEQFIHHDKPSVNITQLAQGMLCANRTTSHIPGISPCASSATLIGCSRQTFGVPVDDLCLLVSPWALISQFIDFDNARVVPTLDELILTQWVMRMAVSDGDSLPMLNPLHSLWTSGSLHFAPDNAATASLITALNQSSNYFRYAIGRTFPTGLAASAYTSNVGSEGSTWGIVEANALTPSSFDVTIRLNRSALSWTSERINDVYSGGLGEQAEFRTYYASGFLTLQDAITKYYLSSVLGIPLPTATLMQAPMGFPAYTNHGFLIVGASQGFIALFFVMSYLYPVSQIAKSIVLEKEQRIREAMLIMGLGTGSFYTSWFATYALEILFSSIVNMIITKYTFFPKSDAGITFFFYFLFGLSSIALAALIASVFSKARMAALVSPLIYFAISIPMFVAYNLPAGAQGVLTLLSPSAMAIGSQLIANHEISGGMGAKQMVDSTDPVNMLAILIMLGVDTILYLLLTLYLDAVFPSEWGTRRHPLFCIIEPYRWFKNRNGGNDEEDGDVPMERHESLTFENADANQNPIQVRIENMRKVFTRGNEQFVAVDNLALQLRENEVTVLLGHNGAGKTTTINMMTGMLQIDKGDCMVYGKSVKNQLHEVRREISLCPQHNILWPELTCAQHLEFYGALKGLTGEELRDAVDAMLIEVDLHAKKDQLSSALSGGQKRKLSVAIAFVGGSRLVFLDEPTAGMDVAARRFTWDLIKRMAHGRTILLTTHFMDEADLLGHNISILSKGKLRASGSPMFLKSRLGVGYTLSLSVAHGKDNKPARDFVMSRVPQAEHVQSGSEEIAFRLPTSAAASFLDLLSGLEDGGQLLGVRDFGITMTTLEDVFIRLAAEDEGHAEGNADHAADVAESVKLSKERALWLISEHAAASKTGTSFFAQFKTLFWKRVHNAKRDRRTQCLQVLIPVIGILVALLLTLLEFFPEAPRLYLDPDMYVKDDINRMLLDLSACATTFNSTLYHHKLVVQDLVSANAEEFSTYLQASAKAHDLWRMTAMYCNDLVAGSNLTLLPTTFLLFNASAYHTSAEALHAYYQAHTYTLNGARMPSMRLASHNLEWTDREKALLDTIKSWMIGIIIMIPFTFIPSTYVGWIVKEKESAAKLLQTVSGMNFIIYWIANLVFDIVAFFGTEFLVIIVFLIFRREEYIGTGPRFGAVFLLLFFFGLSSMTSSYAASFLFKHHTTGQNVTMMVCFLSGFFLVILVNILDAFDGTRAAGLALRYIFRIVPSFCLGEGLIGLVELKLRESLGENSTAFSMKITGWPILYMALEFPIFLIVAIVLDHPARKLRQQQLFHEPDVVPPAIDDEEDDVAAERRRVENGTHEPIPDEDPVTVRHLCKKYPSGPTAVRNLSFGVHKGEVFGFLGTNGAGKTTTIQVLCGEHLPTHGHAYVAGFDVVEESQQSRRYIGYCPQFDALLDLLTVKEHLELYAGLRGVASAAIPQVVEALIEMSCLEEYRDVVSKDLSGGNKRKLSVALSLIGAPKVVFLDEPSAGMDPVARRRLWEVIQAVAEHCSVVLTTHHLEEVEALAHRVAIMVDGKLMCIGDKTHLKTKYGSGFEMLISVAYNPNKPSPQLGDTDPLLSFVGANLPEAVLVEHRNVKYAFTLPQTVRLSQVFRMLQDHAEALNITDYSVTQTSIEQVFLRISAAAQDTAAPGEDAQLLTRQLSAHAGGSIGSRQNSAHADGAFTPPESS